jgi:pimeloyl-ACP methyl ester carboxylesterase
MGINVGPFNEKPSYSVTPKQDVFKTHEKSKVKRVSLNILSTVIFPIGLMRLAKHGLGKLAGKIILPAQLMLTKATLDEARQEGVAWVDDNFRVNHEKLQVKRTTIETADHVKLDTMEILHPEESKKDPKDQKWIVFFPGNGMAYEHLIPLAAQLSKDIGANFYLGNYRGVGYSEQSPSKSKDLIVDGETMVQYLLNEKKIPPENVMVHGWSLGGAVANEVSALHQEKGHEMKLCNDRSFSTLYKEIKALLPAGIGHVAAPIAYSLGWKFNPAKFWKSIAEEHKMLSFHRKDPVIPYKGASLYKNVKEAKMTPADKKLKKERVKAKAKGVRPPKPATHTQKYKPVHAVKHRLDVENPHVESLPGFDTSYGVIENSYEAYLKYVKELLNIPQSPPT